MRSAFPATITRMEKPNLRLDTALVIVAALSATFASWRLAGPGAAMMCAAIAFIVVAVAPENRSRGLMTAIAMAIAFLLVTFTYFPRH